MFYRKKNRNPQGSVPGTLMFVMFINDLPEVIESYCNLNADTSKIIRVNEDDSIDDTLQRDIDSVTNWTKKWLMKNLLGDISIQEQVQRRVLKIPAS